jgi:hypothetical protein
MSFCFALFFHKHISFRANLAIFLSVLHQPGFSDKTKPTGGMYVYIHEHTHLNYGGKERGQEDYKELVHMFMEGGKIFR